MDESKIVDKLIKLSKKAMSKGDVPVGAIIVENNKVIASSYNKKFYRNDSTAHAEILCIKSACKKKKTTYLNDCIMYVSLEPCMMCSSAIIQSHIKKVIFLLKSPKYGYLSKNITNIEYEERYNEKYETILKGFFKDKR